MKLKVCKFGGTSMADAACVNQSAKIVLSDPMRKFVVVSAPGKRNSSDEKVTDLLLQCYESVKAGGKCDEIFVKIASRFDSIISGLKLDLDLSPRYKKIMDKINSGADKEYAASRGEYLMAIVMAARLGFEFVDADEIVRFFADRTFDSEYTNDLCEQRLKSSKGAVIPGFYGRMPDGMVSTFSRGGSDISGAIIARAVKADLYENWTDVNGFMMCDPRIVENPAPIEVLSYKELRELSYMGASVLHPESIFPVRKAGIPINIRNTFEPENKGTMIVPSELRVPDGRIVTGIAGRKGFITIHIEKSMMNSELGFVRKALSVLEHFNISVEHIPSGIDTLNMVIDAATVKVNLSEVLENLKSVLNPDHIEAMENISLIATVGHGMSSKKGTASRLFSALYKNDINVRMIDQGSSELNIIVGVNDEDYQKAIKAIYQEFVQ